MKSFKRYLSESVNISGDFNGNLYMGSAPESVQETYEADMEWNGQLYRIEVQYEGKILGRNELTEMVQSEYPGAIIQNVYPLTESKKIVSSKRIAHDSEWS